MENKKENKKSFLSKEWWLGIAGIAAVLALVIPYLLIPLLKSINFDKRITESSVDSIFVEQKHNGTEQHDTVPKVIEQRDTMPPPKPPITEPNPEKKDNNITKAKEFNSKGLEQDNFYHNYAKAIEYYDKAIELNPKYYQAYRNRSIAKECIGNYKSAFEDIDKAVSLKQTGPNYEQRGDLYCRQGNYSAAVRDYEKAIDLYSKINSVEWSDGRGSTNVSSNSIQEIVLNKLRCAEAQKCCY